jgi:uncharacterized OB-fold protein
MLDRPLPRIDADNAPYWEGARKNELRLQRCSDCGTLRFYPRHHCPDCWSSSTEWVVASGRGRVHSWAGVHRAPFQAFRDDVPYVVALVDLDEGVRVFSRIEGERAAEVAIGAPVEVRFSRVTDDITLPTFSLVDGEAKTDVAA